jgi:hypothetical protein
MFRKFIFVARWTLVISVIFLELGGDEHGGQGRDEGPETCCTVYCVHAMMDANVERKGVKSKCRNIDDLRVTSPWSETLTLTSNFVMHLERGGEWRPSPRRHVQLRLSNCVSKLRPAAGLTSDLT